MAVGIMEVLLVNAKGLHNTDFFGRMDPYAVVTYKTQERKSSVARGGGGSPTWNEKLRFKVEYPVQGHDYKLKLRIMDKDTFSSDDFVGETTIYVEDLLATGVGNGKAEMHPTKYRVVDASESYCGEIQVGVTFTKFEMNAEDEEEEEYGGWKQSSYN